jgi:hypothetical protein
MKARLFLLVGIFALSLVIEPLSAGQRGGRSQSFAVAELFLELNNTDGDTKSPVVPRTGANTRVAFACPTSLLPPLKRGYPVYRPLHELRRAAAPRGLLAGVYRLGTGDDLTSGNRQARPR